MARNPKNRRLRCEFDELVLHVKTYLGRNARHFGQDVPPSKDAITAIAMKTLFGHNWDGQPIKVRTACEKHFGIEFQPLVQNEPVRPNPAA